MHAGTIVASNYSAMAELLGRSFLEHHPESTFTVLVVDDGACDFTEGIGVARLDDLDLGPAVLAVMKTIYDVMEFSTAVKPAFLRLLLGQGEDQQAVACYLDPDIVVYAPFDDQVAPAAEHGIVMTPHALRPVPRDGCHVSEGTIMQSGMYNCGFLAVGYPGREFLDWWDERLRFDAVVDFERSHFTDQRWVDWVPSLFDHVISRDPGMNVAWWNIHERPVSIEATGTPMIGSEPVRFAHFSGYDPTKPEMLSRFQADRPRVKHSIGTGMRTLADDYAARLAELGHPERKRIPYQWGTSIDGVALTADVRREVRSAILAEVGEAGAAASSRRTPDGFGGGSQSLGAWLADRQQSAPDLAPAEPAAPAAPAVASMVPGHAVPQPRFDRAKRLVRSARGASERVRDTASAALPTRRDERASNAPFAFMHVPKSAGSSVTSALRAALPSHRWGDYVFDPAWMGPYRHHPRPPAVHDQVLDSPSQLTTVDAVAGHLMLDTLLTRFDVGDVAAVVREPRSRLLSHYEYWRGLDDAARMRELPWESSRSARSLDFAEWLDDESIAYQIDNTLIRQLVRDAAIPENAFIPNDQLRRLARIASGRIRKLGWVGLVEQGAATWESLCRFVGAPLDVQRVNVTEHRQDLPVDVDALLTRSVPALAARTAGDAIVWQAAAARIGVDNPAVLADSAWMHRVGSTVRSVRAT